MKERGSDLTLFSPRASFMAHHIGDFNVSSTWAAICNELCFRVSQLFPDHFVPRPCCRKAPASTRATCIPELEKCVKEYGNVGHQPEPRPVGRPLDQPAADRPPLVPHLREDGRVRHPGHDPRQHQLQRVLPHHRRALPQRRHHGLHAVLIQGDLFKDFPTLKFLIPHGGGAVPYHWGRFRGLAQEMKKPLLKDHLLNNVFFDTCVYHQPGIDLLTKVIPVRTSCSPAR
jgi:4-oxalmesaconate hydratase